MPPPARPGAGYLDRTRAREMASWVGTRARQSTFAQAATTTVKMRADRSTMCGAGHTPRLVSPTPAELSPPATWLQWLRWLSWQLCSPPGRVGRQWASSCDMELLTRREFCDGCGAATWPVVRLTPGAQHLYLSRFPPPRSLPSLRCRRYAVRPATQPCMRCLGVCDVGGMCDAGGESVTFGAQAPVGAGRPGAKSVCLMTLAR